MIVCTTCYNIITHLYKFFCHSLCIGYYHLSVSLKLRTQGFFCRDRLTSNLIHKRTTLSIREYRRIYLLCQFRLTENNTTTISTKAFLCCRTYEVCISKRRRMNSASNQTSNMSHINKHIRSKTNLFSCFVNKFLNLVILNNTTISRSSYDNHLGLIFKNLIINILVINITSVICTIENHIIKFSAKIYRAAVREMRTILQTHTKNRITGFKYRSVNFHVSG